MTSETFPRVARLYVRWAFARAALHRGWWLVASIYLVVEADLAPFQLVFLGTAQGLTVLACEIPTGVVADTVSRKWSIVVAHALMGLGMAATGLVTAFSVLVVTQMIWGLSWTFSSGADVAWLTDELDDPGLSARVLVLSARAAQLGAALGIAGFGAFGWLAGFSVAMVVAGAGMWVLGLAVTLTFEETNFVPAAGDIARTALGTLRQGGQLACSDRSLLLVFAVTLIVNGADEGFSRLFPMGLIEFGLPTALEPIVWLTMLGLVSLCAGALALQLLASRISGEAPARRYYVGAATIAVVGILMFATAADAGFAMVGVVAVHGIAWPVVRTASVVWANDRATNEVRATVQSFLAQAENAGEVSLGLGLGILAQAAGITSAMVGSAILVVCAISLIVADERR